MNKHLELGSCVALCVLMVGFVVHHASAATITRNSNLTLEDSQISHSRVRNDVWNSGLIDIGLVTLATNDSLTLNINFNNRAKVKLDDGFFNNDEGIHIDVKGAGGVGGAPNNKADFSFQFLPKTLAYILVNPVTGTVGQNALTASVDYNQDVDLVNRGWLFFSGVSLTLTNKNPNNWSFGDVGVRVDADDVTISDNAQATNDLKILQQVLRRELVATVKLAYCESASPTQARCRI